MTARSRMRLSRRSSTRPKLMGSTQPPASSSTGRRRTSWSQRGHSISSKRRSTPSFRRNNSGRAARSVQFTRLRLVGFKSFVDPADLEIGPSMSGIVGPNGCGKSNLVEALRWVMGETSARRLRGDDMDDVIFAGTTARPARNIAEVALTIDNSGRDAPFAFNDRAEIEVVRRIERGGGSTYRVNGREVRARDVQLLFSDAASGAHSGAMVSQGRIGALIDAKPAERRLLLEEAAGTAGLHARRRETELKLDAAEENLERLDDVIATIGGQLDTLKKQARQAH